MCGYEETTVLPDPIESRPINQGDLVDITYPTPPDPVIEKKIIGGKKPQVTVESSLVMGYQCYEISWVTITYVFSTP